MVTKLIRLKLHWVGEFFFDYIDHLLGVGVFPEGLLYCQINNWYKLVK